MSDEQVEEMDRNDEIFKKVPDGFEVSNCNMKEREIMLIKTGPIKQKRKAASLPLL